MLIKWLHKVSTLDSVLRYNKKSSLFKTDQNEIRDKADESAVISSSFASCSQICLQLAAGAAVVQKIWRQLPG